MYLPSMQRHLVDISPADAVQLRAAGRPPDAARALAREAAGREPVAARQALRPADRDAARSRTASRSPAISSSSDGDLMLLPDQLWGNYRLTYEVRLGAQDRDLPVLRAASGFNTEAFANGARRERRRAARS